jgi:hypothetical protein
MSRIQCPKCGEFMLQESRPSKRMPQGKWVCSCGNTCDPVQEYKDGLDHKEGLPLVVPIPRKL